jgi:hypothetical protein
MMKRIAMSVASLVGTMLFVCSNAQAMVSVPNRVPEPSTFILIGAGVAGLAAAKLMRKHRK